MLCSLFPEEIISGGNSSSRKHSNRAKVKWNTHMYTTIELNILILCTFPRILSIMRAYYTHKLKTTLRSISHTHILCDLRDEFRSIPVVRSGIGNFYLHVYVKKTTHTKKRSSQLALEASSINNYENCVKNV
jgi:hypothetical protein